MIYIFTGSNGSGKTLYSLKFICEQLNPDRSRPVYYYSPENQPLNPNPVLLPEFHQITLEQARDWQNFPDGAIFFFDEFRHVFPNRPNNQPAPPFVDALAEHRSHGFDFVLTAQLTASQFDSQIKGFIEEHRHMIGVSGSNRARHLVFQAFCSTPLNPDKLNRPAVESFKFDKKYYAFYRSASIHTKTDRLPYKKLLVLPLLLVLLVVLFVFGYSAISSISNSSVSSVSGAPVSSGMLPLGNKPQAPALDYFEARKPRIKDLPSSAPIYDELTQPVSYPRIAACYQHIKSGSCKCFTQQATPLDISKPVCLQYVRHGSFDHAVPDSRSFHAEARQFGGPASASEARGRSPLTTSL